MSYLYEWRERRPGKKDGKCKKVTYHLIVRIKEDMRVTRTVWTSMWVEYMVRTNTYRVNHNLPATKSGITRYEYVQHGIGCLDDAKRLAEAHFNLLGETE